MVFARMPAETNLPVHPDERLTRRPSASFAAFTHEQIAADPVKLNTNLGYYTNFVNLMDLAAVAAPAGFRANGLPFGISFIGRKENAISSPTARHLLPNCRGR